MRKKLIDKDIIAAEINRRIEKCNIFYIVADNNNAKDAMEEIKREIQHYKSLLDFLNTLEVKEVDLEKEAENFVQTEEFVKNESPVLAIAKHFFELGLNAGFERGL